MEVEFNFNFKLGMEVSIFWASVLVEIEIGTDLIFLLFPDVITRLLGEDFATVATSSAAQEVS